MTQSIFSIVFSHLVLIHTLRKYTQKKYIGLTKNPISVTHPPTVPHTRIVVDTRPQKTYPNRVRITVGVNLTHYTGDVSTNTADLITTKILWNSVFSKPKAKYCCVDMQNLYLDNPMNRYEYTCISMQLTPQAFI